MNVSKKRVVADVRKAFELRDCNIFIHHDEDHMQHVHALIVGPKDTPYCGGFFYFRLSFSEDYPLAPPMCTIMTTGGGTVRFNPNLYANGKVCLSILGTWAGPPWTPAMSLSTVLLSVQSLMGERPMENEPGYETRCTAKDHKDYNAIIQHETVRVAVVEEILAISRGTSMMPAELQSEVIRLYPSYAATYVDICNSNAHLNNKKMCDPFGSVFRGTFSFSSIRNRLDECATIASARETSAAASSSSSVVDEMCSGAASSGDSRSTASEMVEAAAVGVVVGMSDENPAVAMTAVMAAVEPVAGVPLVKLQRSESATLAEKRQKLKEELKCAICFDLLATPASFECGHIFCYACASMCLENTSNCPSCRGHNTSQQLRRVFLDGILEIEALSLFSEEGEPDVTQSQAYKEWTARCKAGLELVNGARVSPAAARKKNSYGQSPFEFGSFGGGSMGHSGNSDDDDDDHHSFHQPFGNNSLTGFGSTGHTLGGSGHSGTASSFMFGGVAAAAATPLSKEEARALRLKALDGGGGGGATTTTHATPNVAVKSVPAVSSVFTATAACTGPLSDMDIQQLKIKKLKTEKEAQRVERERIRLEISRDKEERKSNHGVLPVTYEKALLSKTSDVTFHAKGAATHSSTVLVPAAASASDAAHDTLPANTEDCKGQQMTAGQDSSTETCVQASGHGGGAGDSNIDVQIAVSESIDKILISCGSRKDQASAALKTILSMLENIITHPSDFKYQSFKLQSKVFKDILFMPGALSLFHAVGFNQKKNPVDCANGGEGYRMCLDECDLSVLCDACSVLHMTIDEKFSS